MRSLLILGLVLLTACAPAKVTTNHVLHSQGDESRLLWAIAQVESGGKLDAKGNDGEMGEYQMSPKIISEWAKNLPPDSKESFRAVAIEYANGSIYMSGEDQFACALWHLHQIETSHYTFDPRTLFQLWNPGQPEETTDREMNLYNQKTT